jgi:hypothetical protein
MIDGYPSSCDGLNIYGPKSSCDSIGDLDNDRIVYGDYLIIDKYLSNPTTYPLNQEQKIRADVDGNNEINLTDRDLILYFESELDFNFPVCKDPDRDGFAIFNERHMGTDENSRCPKTATSNDEAVDALPSDFDDNRSVGASDISRILTKFGKNSQSADWNQAKRFDLDANGAVGASDISIVIKLFGKYCSD